MCAISLLLRNAQYNIAVTNINYKALLGYQSIKNFNSKWPYLHSDKDKKTE